MRDLLSRLVIVIALISIIGCSAAPAAPDAASAQSAKERAVATAVDSDVHEATRGNAALALDLYRQLRREGGNLFFSPHSISLALAMTYAGARGTTATEMAETLHYTLPSERLHAAFNTLDQLLAQRGADAQGQDGEGFRLTIANAVWGQTGFPFLEPFLDTLAEHYGAGMRLVDYEADAEAARRTINAWVSDETEERITELLGPGAVDAATRLVLTNAIYFSAAWAYPSRARRRGGHFLRAVGRGARSADAPDDAAALRRGSRLSGRGAALRRARAGHDHRAAGGGRLRGL